MTVQPDRYRDPVSGGYDAVVVGAGMGGLVAAALLSGSGRETLVLDGHYVAGGNATVFRRGPFEFDVGVHYLGDCSPKGLIPRILMACGARKITFRPMEGELEQLSFPDFEFTIPRDKPEFRQRLLDRFPAEGRGINRYLRFLDEVDRVQQASLGGSKRGRLGALIRCPLVMRYASKPLGEFLDSCSSNEKLRAVLTAQNGTYAVAPARVSALLHAGLQNHYLADGGWYPEGGGQIMADRLAGAIEVHGGQIRLRAKVDRIHVSGGRVEAVTFHNKHLGCKTVKTSVVVSNADLKRTVLELVGAEHFPAALAERVRHFEMALPLFVVYLGLDLAPSDLPYGNVNRWLFSDYDFDAAYGYIKRGQMPEKPFLYIATTSLKDPHNKRIAPPGHTNMQLMTVVPSDPAYWGVSEAEATNGSYVASERYRARKRELMDRLILEAERAVPGLGEHVVLREAATPLTHTRYTRSTGGTSYGIAATAGQFLQRRPPAATPVGGLYLAGASTRSGHGIAGAMLSGLYAADSVVGGGLLARVLSRH